MHSFTPNRFIEMPYNLQPVSHSAIDLDKITQKQVRRFITNYGLYSTSGFVRMRSAGYDATTRSPYRKHHKKFLIRKKIDEVWDNYMTIHPRDAWTGEMVSFGLQYSSRQNKLNYIHDTCDGIEIGQIIILNLKLLWGAVNIAVAHKVEDVNHEEKIIKLSYMMGGASEGSQWISLKETEEGHTEVHHDTLYRSKSAFRDTRLYPGLHTKAITEFHNSVRRQVEG